MQTRRPIFSHEARLRMYTLINSPVRFARCIASSRRHFAVGRALQFARWFLRHRGPVPAASTSRYQFVYHLARHLRESSTLRIMAPLHVSQVTYAPGSRTVERWMQVAPATTRDLPVSPSSIFYGPASLWRPGRAQSEFDQPPRLRTAEPIHRLFPSAAAQTTMPAAPRWLTPASDSRSALQPGPVQQHRDIHRGLGQSTLVLRSQTVTSVLPSGVRSAHQPTTPTRWETRPQERVFDRVSALAPVRGSFVPQPGVVNSTQSFFSSWVTAPFTLLNNYFAGTAFSAVRSQVDTRIFEGAAVPFGLATTVPSAGPEARFTHLPAVQDRTPSLSFAARLPGARTTRELESSPGMTLSVRPEQVLATANTSYVYAQQPRPVAADPGSSLAGGRREIVDLVQKEVRHAMSSGAVVQHFTRHDYASITDQVESLLRRRLVVEKERLGFPG